MKNIHIIPTDKPNFGKYLVLNKEGRLCIWNTNTMGSQKTLSTQHIYMTSDEEIKPNVYALINKVLCKTELFEGKIVSRQLSGGATMDICKSEYFEIILTTDPQLIQEGVQSIDNEFLEWFVKNPSCEEVKVVEKQHFEADKSKRKNPLNGVYYSYKIIIPKEELTISDEAKQRAKNYMSLKGALEPKQETLEEAAENHINKLYTTYAFKEVLESLFIDGAKWQAERMYSEEDLKQFAFECVANFLSNRENKVEIELVNVISDRNNELFKQFKKK